MSTETKTRYTVSRRDLYGNDTMIELTPMEAAAPKMYGAHKDNGSDAHDALARLPSTEWVGHAETRDIMALFCKLRERLVAIAKRSDAALADADGREGT